MPFDVTKSGPLFDGVAPDVIKAAQDEIEQEIGDYTVDKIQNELSSVLVNPTGYYRSRVTTNRQADDISVTDGGVVYGPWLEGVGSRNKSTRFKGYSTFRRITQRVQSEVGPIAERVMSKYIGRLQ